MAKRLLLLISLCSLLWNTSCNTEKEKKEEGYETWISFSGEKQKERLESIFEELNHDLPFKSFKSDLPKTISMENGN